LEIEKINNALNLGTKKEKHELTIRNLTTIKEYYAQMGDFIMSEQARNRHKELEFQFSIQLEEFLKFWQKTMKEFQKISKQKIEAILTENKVLAEELKELLEKITGFKAPPDELFLSLMAIRKIALKLQSKDVVQYINFDYFQKHNKNMNENILKTRREKIKKRIKNFEKKLENHVKSLKDRLDQELNRLHIRRQNQLSIIMAKYNKCKKMIGEINSQESYQLKVLKKHFILRNDVPTSLYSDNGLEFLEFEDMIQDKNLPLQKIHTKEKNSLKNLKKDLMSTNNLQKTVTFQTKI
jgi:hypothetical protein